MRMIRMRCHSVPHVYSTCTADASLAGRLSGFESGLACAARLLPCFSRGVRMRKGYATLNCRLHVHIPTKVKCAQMPPNGPSSSLRALPLAYSRLDLLAITNNVTISILLVWFPQARDS